MTQTVVAGLSQQERCHGHAYTVHEAGGGETMTQERK
jgi:hypothetical protein